VGGELGVGAVDLRVVRSGLSTPVFTLSGTRRAGTPPKNANASTWQRVHAPWSIRSTGRTNRYREHAKTMTNACTVCRRPVPGSVHTPKRP